MSKTERYLEQSGFLAGSFVVWLARRVVDNLRSSSRQRSEKPRNRSAAKLPPRAKEACERAVQKALSGSEGLTSFAGGLAEAMKQPALRLCSEIISYERRVQNWHRSTERIEKILGMFVYNLLITGRMDDLLTGGESEEAMFSVPLHTLHAGVASGIERVGTILAQECTQDGRPLPRLWKKYADNLCWASGIDPDEEELGRKEPVLAKQVKGKSPSELVQTYLRETPFTDFFNTSVPISIPLASRFEHMHIVGGSGHGKTQLLQYLILHDLPQVLAGKRSIIVIDSQGDLLKNILSLSSVGAMADRVVLIDPNDSEYPPALNLFDFGLDRIDRYKPVEQDKHGHDILYAGGELRRLAQVPRASSHHEP